MTSHFPWLFHDRGNPENNFTEQMHVPINESDYVIYSWTNQTLLPYIFMTPWPNWLQRAELPELEALSFVAHRHAQDWENIATEALKIFLQFLQNKKEVFITRLCNDYAI